jgi:hypothetical protein
MEEVLDSVRRIVSRWTVNNVPLISDTNPGDTAINVTTTLRFKIGDEVMLRNQVQAETPLIIQDILDTTHVLLTTPLQFQWKVSDNALMEKTFFQNFVQQIYLGDMDNAPKFPCITVSGETSTSEWITLRSTKEAYNLKIGVYVQANNQENTYRYLLKLTNMIQWGLKHNFFPMVGPYQVTSVISDIHVGDTFVKVADSSIFDPVNKHRVLLEDLYQAEDLMVLKVFDAHTIQVSRPICFDYPVSAGAKMISVSRLIYNSWPNNIQYGTIFKGSLLKAATIDWFAWEEEIQKQEPLDTSLT